jgi:hypothetical protein
LGSDAASVRDANVAVQLGVYRGRQSATTYDTAPLALVKGVPYYWRIDEVNNSPTEIFKGRVWSFTLDDNRAYDPYPSDTGTVDTIEPTLSWSPGTDSNSHDVYFGTDQAAVENADTNDTAIFVGNRNVNNYSPGLLSLGTTYYWRIDEVNTVTYKGHVWCFTITDYFVVEDFNSYADDAAIRVVWKDYWNDPASKNGAQVYVETNPDFVRSGKSMKYYYVNNNLHKIQGKHVGSWAEADTSDLGGGPNWTAIGSRALVLYFYGDPCNGQDTSGLDQDQMYVALEDGDSNEGVVEYPDMNHIMEDWWHEWNVDLQDFNNGGVTLSNVAKVYIGFGGPRVGQTADGAGMNYGIGDTIYFEDITVAASRCVLGYGLQPRVDLSADCYVDRGADAYDSSGHGYTATYEQDPCDANSYPTSRLWNPDGYDSNGCIEFDGIFSMSVPANPFWYMDPSQITISAWVKGVVMQPSVWQTLFHAKKWLNYGDYWMVGQWRPDDFIYSMAEDDWVIWHDAEYAIDEDWHHYAFVNNVNTGEMIMYVDGVPVVTTNATLLMGGVNEFHIGGPAASLEDYDDAYMSGLVDDFRIYGAALSHSEIVKLAGLESVHVGVVPWFLPSEPYADDKVDLKDYALIASRWLEVPKWP